VRTTRSQEIKDEAIVLTNEHHVVNRMIFKGAGFDHIEDYINSLELPSEQLSALWLLAWAEATDPLTRQRVVAEAIASCS
jgi:hypothetical protein